jgi:Glycosyl hydrolase family 26
VNNPLSKTGLDQFAAYRHRAVDVAITYTDRSSWSAIDNPWILQQYAGYAGKLVIGVPLTVTGTSLSAVAAGTYDSYFTTFARNLNAAGRADSIIRLGWEFNGNWYAWSAYDPTTYIAAFRHVVAVLRAADPRLSIDWNGNLGSSQCGNDPLTTLYPGDGYVDIVGLDAYDTKWAGVTSLTAFDQWTKQSRGLNAWYAFAVQHHKPFSVPEWGVITNSTTSSLGEGDNPVYIHGMFNWFQAHAAGLAYEAYFNDPYNADTANSFEGPDQMPASAAAYASLWSVP